jgi:hypothetical protein
MSTTSPASTHGLAAPPETLVDDPPVRHVMAPLAPLEVPATTWVGTALVRLRHLGTDHLVTRVGGQVRAVSEVDLLRHLLERGPRLARMRDPVAAVAVPVPTVDPTLRRSRAAELLLEEGGPALLLVADGTTGGVLDARTLLHSVAEERPRSR